MTVSVFEKVIGDFDGKRRWRNYRARLKALPAPYRTAVAGFEHYLMYFGAISSDMTIFEDLMDLFERAAADGTSIRDIVGDDPLEFIETFKQSYVPDGWVAKEHKKLADAIARAEREQGS
ncbi:MAG: DUF1048 domain-containing protein [Microbacteriaceae bacterium]|nr:DUF1048 domain-containing protein [Microbacteriaceae bacterium]